jgi:hypothetical protein
MQVEDATPAIRATTIKNVAETDPENGRKNDPRQDVKQLRPAEDGPPRRMRAVVQSVRVFRR